MRLALAGAFAFPALRGSQRFAADQARALAAAGAEVTLLCYGHGAEGAPLPPGVTLVRTPAALAARRACARFHPAKPASDVALAAALLRAHRGRRFDAVLAHGAEATAAALAARALGGPPVVYLAPTLWREELSAYLPAALAAAARRAGGRLDRALARRADAVLCLTQAAADALGAHARGPRLRLPPGLTPEAAPGPAEIAIATKRAGVAPGAYALYAGNLDRHQDLPLLDAAAARVPELPCLVVTHDPRGPVLPHLRVLVAEHAGEVRALVHGAALVAEPRRRLGAFPLELLDAMEAARPVVAFEGVADTLEHDRSAWLLPPGAGPEAVAGALRALAHDPARAWRLGEGARLVLEERHAWPPLAAATLELAALAAGRG